MPEDYNPYLAAKEQWEEQFGSLLIRNRNLTRIAGVQLLVLVILAAGLVLSRQQTHIVPYVAVVDSNAHLWSVAHLERGRGDLPEAVRQQLLIDWLIKCRSVTPDWPQQRQMITDVLDHSSDSHGGATTFLQHWYEQTRPDRGAQTGSTHVEVTSVVPYPPNSGGYQVEWTETPYSLDGAPAGEAAHWKGYVHVALEPPSNNQMASRNPVGFVVTQISWSKQLKSTL